MFIVTLGDPWSVNIELVERCLTADVRQRLRNLGMPIIAIGSMYHCQNQGLSPEITAFFDEFHSVDLPQDPKVSAPELAEKFRGELAYRSLQAVKKYQAEHLAVLTMPIDKHACWQAGFDFPGQTEYFEHIWQRRGLMILAGPQLKVGLLTTHVPLNKVTELITAELLDQKIRMMMHGLEMDFGITNPRLAVAGLNPHCGDHGLFGHEDQAIVKKTIGELQELYGERLEGPLPADTVFYHAYHGHYDGVLAMYHDQGLGPLKTVHFDTAINLTACLPHLRVSPDHGPARDLFGKKQASQTSTQFALEQCLRYLERRK